MRPPGRPPASVSAVACAKVNVGLRVGARRPDGYHEIAGIATSVDLHDTLDILVTDEPEGAVVVDVEGEPFALTVLSAGGAPDLESENNLVVRAARVLAEALAPRPTQVALTKRIPVAAGLGGGSADAAACLVALSVAWGGDVGGDKARRLAARVGSDVPAVLTGGLVHVSGRGEVVRSIGCAEGTWFVLGIADGRLCTPDVYDRFDSLSAPARTAWWSNDLEDAAISLRPSLREAIDAMRRAGAVASFVTGSGPTVVGVASGEGHAHEIANRAVFAFRMVRVCPATSWGVRVRLGP